MAEVIALSMFFVNIVLILGTLYRKELRFLKNNMISVINKFGWLELKGSNDKHASGGRIINTIRSTVDRVPSASTIKYWGGDVDARESRDVLTFGICLASKQASNNWDVTCELLDGTLQSLLNQTNPNFRVIICGHEMPEISGIKDERIAFLSLNAPPPSSSSRFRSDKTSKRFNIGRALRQSGGGYYMQLDADDRVSSHLVERVLTDKENGVILAAGYALDWQSRLIAPVPGVWPFGLNKVCGSTSVVFFGVNDLPGPDDGTRNSTLLWNMTRQHEHVDVALFESGRPLDVINQPYVVYIVNHQQNLSFRMQKADIRGGNIVSAIREKSIKMEEDLRKIEQEFGFPSRFLEKKSQAA